MANCRFDERELFANEGRSARDLNLENVIYGREERKLRVELLVVRRRQTIGWIQWASVREGF